MCIHIYICTTGVYLDEAIYCTIRGTYSFNCGICLKPIGTQFISAGVFLNAVTVRESPGKTNTAIATILAANTATLTERRTPVSRPKPPGPAPKHPDR